MIAGDDKLKRNCSKPFASFAGLIYKLQKALFCTTVQFQDVQHDTARLKTAKSIFLERSL
jgi:hypothetical protein